MSVSRAGSFFAAAVATAGLSLVGAGAGLLAAPAAYADGFGDCVRAGHSTGVKDPAQACSYAKGGDTEDCQQMMKHSDGWAANDEAATAACAKAAPSGPGG